MQQEGSLFNTYYTWRLRSLPYASEQPHLLRGCGDRFYANENQFPGQHPTSPFPLEALTFLEHCEVAQRKCLALMKS